jgi:hypothetical protein
LQFIAFYSVNIDWKQLAHQLAVGFGEGAIFFSPINAIKFTELLSCIFIYSAIF